MRRVKYGRGNETPRVRRGLIEVEIIIVGEAREGERECTRDGEVEEGGERGGYVVHVVMVAYAHRPYRKRTLVCLCVRCLALLLAPLRACVCVEACGCGEFISPAHCLLNSLYSSEGQLFPLSSRLTSHSSSLFFIPPSSFSLSQSLAHSLSGWLLVPSGSAAAVNSTTPHPPRSSSKDPL